MLVFIMMAVGLNIVVGYAGLLDLGYVAFYAMGAYTAAWFASLAVRRCEVPEARLRHRQLPGRDRADDRLQPRRRRVRRASAASTSRSGCCWSPPALLTALIGVLIGLPTLRLRGDYLAIVTLGFGEIMPQIARNGNDLCNTAST